MKINYLSITNPDKILDEFVKKKTTMDLIGSNFYFKDQKPLQTEPQISMGGNIRSPAGIIIPKGSTINNKEEPASTGLEQHLTQDEKNKINRFFNEDYATNLG